MNRNLLFYTTVAAVLTVAVISVIRATQQASAQVLLPSALAAAPNDHFRIRVAGRVAQAPIDYRTEPTLSLHFHLDDPGSKSGDALIPVVYEGLKPDMFAVGRDVIIDGHFENGTLIAKRLLTQCPSKYEPPDPAQHALDDAWQR